MQHSSSGCKGTAITSLLTLSIGPYNLVTATATSILPYAVVGCYLLYSIETAIWVYNTEIAVVSLDEDSCLYVQDRD